MKNRPVELVYGKEVFLYDSVHSLSACLSIGMESLIRMIGKGKGCVHDMHLEFRIVGETEEERLARLDKVGGKKEEQKKDAAINKNKTGARPIEVIFADGGKAVYDSIGECSASIGVGRGTIHKAMARGGYMPTKQLSFRFLDEN